MKFLIEKLIVRQKRTKAMPTSKFHNIYRSRRKAKTVNDVIVRLLPWSMQGATRRLCG